MTASREWAGMAFLNAAFSLLFVTQLSYVNTHNLCMPLYEQFLDRNQLCILSSIRQSRVGKGTGSRIRKREEPHDSFVKK